MIVFKTKAPVIMPGISEIKDEATRNALQDINKILQNTVRDILDDLKTLERVERISTMPAASLDSEGKFVMLLGTGSGANKIYLGTDTGNGGYAYKLITIAT